MAGPVDGTRFLTDDESIEYDRLVEEEAAVPLFADRQWIDRAARALGGGVRVAGVFRGGRLEAAIALPVRRRLAFPIATAPYLVPYLSILARENRTRNIRALLPFLAKRFRLVSLLPPPPETDLRAFAREGWELAYRYTLHIDLRGRDADSLLALVDSAQRRRIRRIAEGGAEVRRGDADEHCRLVFESYRRQGKRFPLSAKAARELVRWIVESERGRIYQLVRGERVIATSLIGLDRLRAYALEGGIDPRGRQGGEAAYLHLRILARLASEGVTGLDALGLNHPGISRFKESMPGCLTRYHKAVPPVPAWARAILRLRGVSTGLEITGEGPVSR